MFMPKSRRGWVAVGVLCLMIVSSGIVFGHKVALRQYFLDKWQWQETASRFPAAPISKSDVAKYGDRVPHDTVEKQPVTGSVTYHMGDLTSIYAKHGTWTGTTFGFTLAIYDLQTLLSGVTDTSSAPSTSVSSCNASASIALYKINPTVGDDQGAIDAYTAWLAAANPPGGSFIYCFVFKATAQVGSVPGDSDAVYLATGWYQTPPVPTVVWYGVTQWVLGGTFSISNVVVKGRTDTYDFGSVRVAPRTTKDIRAQYILFAEAGTQITATIGGASATYDYTFPDDLFNASTGAIIGGSIADITSTITYLACPANNTSYAEVQDISMAGDIPINTNCSMWSADGSTWTASVSDPGGSKWHFFNSGATFKLHRVATGDVSASCSVTTQSRGPLRYNINAGRFGYNNPTFSLPGTIEFDVGLTIYTSETVTETVWLQPGLSQYYTESRTYLSSDVSQMLLTGTHHFPFDPSVYCKVRASWLTTYEEDLENGTVNNFYGKIALHKLNADLASDDPYWGPLVVYTQQSSVTVDKPPGYTTRPSAWTAVSGVTVNIADNSIWTVATGGGQLRRDLVTRKYLRYNYLQSRLPVGSNADGDWNFQNKANYYTSNDITAWITAVPTEDVTNWDNFRILAVTFSSVPVDFDPTAVTMTLGHSYLSISDPWYTCFGHRWGSEGEWEHTRTQVEHDFNGQDGGAVTILFDLDELRRKNAVNLQHVDSIVLNLPLAGTYQLSSWNIVQDPSEHGGGAGTYPHWITQQAIDPWNWDADRTGFGSTVEGMPHLNLINGAETYMSLGVQRGIWQTQLRQHCPDTEDPTPTDYDYVISLSRLCDIITTQEGLTCAYQTATITAGNVDEDGNSLGSFYPWDLERQTGDDANGDGAIHVGDWYAVPHGVPHVKMTANMYWTTHGRGQGRAWSGGTVVRSTGGSYDNAATGSIKVYKRLIGGTTWTECGSCTPDVTGRYVTPPLKESGYEYGVKAAESDAEPTLISRFVTREYADLDVVLATESEIYVVEHSSNIIFVFDWMPEQGINHIYTAPPRQWYDDSISLAPYSLPRRDVSNGNTDGSPAGYVDKQGRLLLYYLKDGDLKKIISTDWGQNWSVEATVITGEDISKCIEIWQDGMSYCFAVNGSGDAYLYRSNSHFADGTWTLGLNKFAITTGADLGQPGGYFSQGKMYCYVTKAGVREGYESLDFGQNWTLIT